MREPIKALVNSVSVVCRVIEAVVETIFEISDFFNKKNTIEIIRIFVWRCVG